jgi:metallo-beta-lactamase class B
MRRSINSRAPKLALCALLVAPLLAQAQPAGAPTREQLANDNKLFLGLARKALHWDEPTEPVKIVGPLYYVGTRGLSSFLFATPEGHILWNTGMPGSGPMIVESIRKLGFKPEDIRYIINGHGHSDHAGDVAYMQRVTGAKLAIMAEDVPLIESGGKTDFHYGRDWQVMGQPPAKVDIVLRDGDVIALGGVRLVAHHTPGHTKGGTTWEAQVADGGRVYDVVFAEGTSINPGYRIAGEGSYPGIAEDFRASHRTLETLKPDIWLSGHAEMFGFEAKRERASREGVRAWMDPEGYRRFIAKAKRAFEDEMDAELGAAPAKAE